MVITMDLDTMIETIDSSRITELVDRHCAVTGKIIPVLRDGIKKHTQSRLDASGRKYG
jgi:hypothetical protein